MTPVNSDERKNFLFPISQLLTKATQGRSIVSLLLCLLLLTAGNDLFAQAAGDYRSNVANGNWSTPGTWQRFNGTSWVAATDYPGQNTGAGTVTIQTGNSVTVNITVPNPIGALVITGTLVHTANFRLTVSGDVSGAGTYTVNNPSLLNIRGNYSYSGGISNANRLVVEMEGGNSQTISGNTNFRTLIVNKTSGTAVTLNTNLNIRDGDLTITSGTLNAGTFSINQTNGIKGTFSIASGARLILGASNFPTPGADGYEFFTISSGSTVEYNAAGVQTVAARAYSNLTFSGSGNKTIATGTSVTGILSIGGTALANIGAGLNISVDSLTLGGKGRINGTWGSLSSTATNRTNTFFAATTGILTVTTDTRPLVTVTALNQTKFYGTTSPTTGTIGTNVTVTGLLNGDAASGATLAYSGNGQLATTAPGSFTITPSALTFSSGPTEDYQYSYVNGTLTINPAQLTVSGAVASNKVYDGTTTATVTGGTLVGVISPDVVTLNQSGAFVDKNVGNIKTVNGTCSLSGADAGKYTLIQPSGLTANITEAPLTITARDTSKCAGYTFNPGTTAFNTSGLVPGETITSVTLTSAGSGAGAAVGTYPITPSNPTGVNFATSNYSITFIDGTLTVRTTPADPANPTSNSPQCANVGVTLTRTGTPGVNETWYWQTALNGISITDAGATYLVNSSGTYYIRALNTATSCWSVGAGSASVTVNPNPTISFSTQPGAVTNVNSSVTYTTQAGQSSYVWSVPGVAGTDYNITAGGIGSTSNTVTLTWLTLGNKTVTVNYSNASGCTGLSAASNTTFVENGKRYSVATGNWNVTSTWSQLPGGSPGAPVPATGQEVYIQNGNNVTLNVNSASLALLNISSTSRLSTTGANTLTATTITVDGYYLNGSTGTVTGTMSVNAGATYEHGLNGGAVPAATWNTTSTCLITGVTGTIPTGTSQNFGNFTWNCLGQNANENLGNPLNLKGNLTIMSTGAGANTLRLVNDQIGTIQGSYIQSGGSVTIRNNNPHGLTISGDFQLTGGTFANQGGGTGTLDVGGNYTITGGTLTNQGTLMNVTFGAGSKQHIFRSGATVSGTISYQVNAGDTLQMFDATTVVNGTNFTLAAGATLGVTSPDGITAAVATATGNIRTTGTRVFTAGAHYIYNGNGPQLTGTGLQANTIGNLTINNAAGVTLSGNTTMSGILNLTNGLLTTGSNTITVNSTGSIINASASSYVNGRLARVITGTAATSFPVGKGGNYRPVTFTYASAPGSNTVTIEQFESGSPLSLSSVSTSTFGGRYWNIAQSATGTAYTVGLNNGGVTPAGGTVVMLRREGTGATTQNATTFSSPVYSNASTFSTGNTSNDVALGLTNIPLTITGASVSNKQYDGNTSATVTGGTLVGVLSGDVVGFTAAFNNKDAGNSKPIIFTLTGANAGAYTLTDPGITANITPAPLTITANNASKCFGFTANLGTSAFTTSSLISGESVTSVTLTSTGSAAIADPGTYPIIPSNPSGTNFLASNYNINFLNGTLTVFDLPSFTSDPSTTPQTLCQNAAATALSVTAVAGSGTITSYQWYSNTVSSSFGGTLISGANSSTYTPPTNVAGTLYYYCVVTNSGGCSTPSNVSGAVTVNALPTAVTVSGGGNVCDGTLLTASNGNSGTIYYQGTVSGGTSTAVPAVTQFITQSGTYYFRALSAQGCWGPEGSATVTILAPVTTGVTICTGGSGSLQASGSCGGSFDWFTVASGGTSIGSGASFNPVGVPGSGLSNTNTPGSVTYYVECSSNPGCRSTAVFTINARAGAPTASDVSACVGTATSLTASTDPGFVIDWYDSPSGGSLLLSSSTTYPIASLITTVTVYAESRNSTTGCVSTSRTAVTATPIPNASVGSVSGTSPLCIGASATFSANAVVLGGGTGAWSSSNTLVATVNSNTGEVSAVNPGSADITYTITGGCGGTVSAFASVTVNPNVNAGTVSGTSPLCQGATTTFSSNGDAGGTWSSDNESVATVNPSTGLVTAVSGGTANIIYTISTGCGAPVSAQASITVNASQPVSVSIAADPGNTICAGTSVTFTATPTNGGSNPTYQWFNGASPISGETGVTYTTTTLANGDQITVVLTSDISPCPTGNPATSNIITMTVNQPVATPGPITGPTDACPHVGTNVAVTYSIDAVPGAVSYEWVAPNGATIQSGQGTTSINVLFDNSYALTGQFFRVRTISAEGCPSAYSSLLVLKNVPAIPAAINGPTNACPFTGQPVTVTYSVAPVQYATGYSWTVAGTGISIVSGNGTTSVQVSFAANFTTGSIRCTATSQCGSRSARSLSIGRLIPTAPVAINGPTNACAFIGTPTQVTYSVNPVDNATSYFWTVPAGVTLVSGQNSTSINVTFSGSYSSGIFRCRSVSNCFTSGDRQLTVGVGIPAVPVLASGPLNACSFVGTNTQATYTVNPVAGASSYTWTLPANVNVISGLGTNSLTVTFGAAYATSIFRVRSVGACGSSSDLSFTITAASAGTPGGISGPTNACQFIGTANEATYTIRKVANAISYNWTVPAGATITSHPAGLGANDTIITVTYNNSFLSGTAISVTAQNCNVSSPRSLVISRVTASTPGPISGPVNVCEFMQSPSNPSGTIAVYTIRKVNGATSYSWTAPANASIVANPGGPGANDTIVHVIYNSSFVSGSFSVTASNACGTSTARTLAVTRLLPGAPSAIDVIMVSDCPSRVYSYTLAAMPTNSTSVNWTVPAGGSITAGQGTTSITVSYGGAAVNGNITATGISNCGTGTTRSLSVKLAACPPEFTKGTSIATMPTASADVMDVKVFPNPSVSDFKVQVQTNAKEIIHVRVLDMSGRAYQVLQMMPGETLSLGSTLKAGNYVIEVTQGGKRTLRRLIRL